MGEDGDIDVGVVEPGEGGVKSCSEGGECGRCTAFALTAVTVQRVDMRPGRR
jgi:hypothetical protein